MWVSGQLHASCFTHDERDRDTTGGIEGWIGSTYGWWQREILPLHGTEFVADCFAD